MSRYSSHVVSPWSVDLLDREGEVSYSRDFDAKREALDWINDCARNEDYLNRMADRDRDRDGWAKDSVEEIRLNKNGEAVREFSVPWGSGV